VTSLIVAGAALAAGCGSGVDPGTVQQAAKVTREAATARVGWSVTTKGFGLPGRLTVKGDGTTALDAARMDLRFDLAPVLEVAGAQAAGGRARLVVRGRDVYVKPPRVRGFALPGGAAWVALDLERALAASGPEAAGLGEVLTIDPKKQIDVLDAAEGVEEVGPEKVGGDVTTRYRGQLNLSTYAKGLPAERRAKAEQTIESFAAETGGEQAQPFEVWIDAQDRIRRMRQTSRTPAQDGVPQGEVGITMELSDFGAAVDADPPAKDETFDATARITKALAASQ
jgi:hypothetical protein